MCLIGAIIGDIAGSRFEFNNYHKKDFKLFSNDCYFTDDTVMTLAVAKAIKENINIETLSEETIISMQKIGRLYPNCGYGKSFYSWIFANNPKPYNSYGNGSAMRVAYCGIKAKNIDEVKRLSYEVTKISHNHYEGLKGAEATAVCIFLTKNGYTKEQIRKYIIENYYKLDFTIDEIRPNYKFNETCQETVPQALQAFFESSDFEDAIRIAISLGGDSDTLAAITGSIAGAYYGVPKELEETALNFLDNNLLDIFKALIK